MKDLLTRIVIAAVIGLLPSVAATQTIVPGASLRMSQTLLCNALEPLEAILLESAKSYEEGLAEFNKWNTDLDEGGLPVCVYVGYAASYSIGEINDVVHTLNNSDGSSQLMQIARVAYQTTDGPRTGWLIVLSHMTKAPTVKAEVYYGPRLAT